MQVALQTKEQEASVALRALDREQKYSDGLRNELAAEREASARLRAQVAALELRLLAREAGNAGEVRTRGTKKQRC